MYKVRAGASAKLQVQGILETLGSRTPWAITPVFSNRAIPTLIEPRPSFKGLHPPQFYLVELPAGRFRMRGWRPGHDWSCPGSMANG